MLRLFELIESEKRAANIEVIGQARGPKWCDGFGWVGWVAWVDIKVGRMDA